MLGPEVSFRGSPTVSPTTAAPWGFECLIKNSSSSFKSLSRALSSAVIFKFLAMLILLYLLYTF
jgi:hypothetical protein